MLKINFCNNLVKIAFEACSFVFQVNLVQMAKMVHQDHQDEVAQKDLKENQVHQDPQDQLDLKDFQVQMGTMEIKVSLDQQGHLDHQVNKDQMAHQVPMVQWVHQDYQEVVHPIVPVHHDVLLLPNRCDDLYSYCFTSTTIISTFETLRYH